MKSICRSVFVTVIVFSLMFLNIYGSTMAMAAKAEKNPKAAKVDAEQAWAKPNARFDANKLSDMTGFDATNPINPRGDTIKIAFVDPFSGPGAINGQLHILPILFAAYDINKRGGIMVDGKKKLIEVIAADTMSKADQCKKICERMVLQEKVHILMGTTGSNMMKIINSVANKYKLVSVNASGVADDLQNAENFGRYSFMLTPTTDQIGRGMAYFYGQVRKKEKKFYILCQDYSFGHELADSFKAGLKQYYPGAQIVGEDYHKLFLTDFAPYLTKVKSSGAEAIFTGDFVPDSNNLLKQAREMGIKVPFANLYMDEPNGLHEIGVEGTKGLHHIDVYDMPYVFKNHPEFIKLYKAWNNQWKNKWTAPYNTRLYEHGYGTIGLYVGASYWLFSVIERAKSTDPEKIIKVWEGDVYQYPNGKIVKMRACDHKTIQPLAVTEYVPPAEQKVSMSIPPYYWFQGTSSPGPAWLIPADKVIPPMDQNIDRCKGKNDWSQ
jgi:branched-chain amino acid transport system substrate-binding protein